MPGFKTCAVFYNTCSVIKNKMLIFRKKKSIVVPGPLPLAYSLYVFKNVENRERPLNKLNNLIIY